MVPDHRGDELPVTDKSLGPGPGEGEHEQRDKAGIEDRVETPVRIHPAHGR